MKNLFKADSDGNATQLKAYYPALQANLSFQNIADYINQTQATRLKPLLGERLLEALAESFDAGTLSSADQTLLPHVQRALVYFVLSDNLHYLDSFIGNAGIQESNTKETAQKPRWKFDALLESLYRSADNLSEELLLFLERNASDYPLWSESQAYTIAQELLVSNTFIFNEAININQRRQAYTRLLPFIKRAERDYIAQNISKAFFDVLKTQAKSQAIEERNALILPLVQEAICFQAFASALPTLQVTQDENGLVFIINAQMQKQKIDSNTKLELRTQYENFARAHMERILSILNNSPDTYPEFKNSPQYTPPTAYQRPTLDNEGRTSFAI